jgi:hypothetical protein
VALAEIYPLVTARALARPFTYRVPEDVAQGDVLSIRLGAPKLRGVVVETGVAAPQGVELADAGSVVDRVPAPLVELALWLADYYGSTPPARWHSSRRTPLAVAGRCASRPSGRRWRRAGAGRADQASETP